MTGIGLCNSFFMMSSSGLVSRLLVWGYGIIILWKNLCKFEIICYLSREPFKCCNHLALCFSLLLHFVFVFTRILGFISSWGSFGKFFLSCSLSISFKFPIDCQESAIYLPNNISIFKASWFCSFLLIPLFFSIRIWSMGLFFSKNQLFALLFISISYMSSTLLMFLIFISYILHSLSVFFFPVSNVLGWKLSSLILSLPSLSYERSNVYLPP